MSQSVHFTCKTSIQTKRNIKNHKCRQYLLNLFLPVPVDGQFSSAKSKSHTGLWKHRNFLCSQSACPFIGRRRRKWLGALSLDQYGTSDPPLPSLMGEPFCSLSRVRKLGTSSSHFVPDSQRMPDTNKQRVRMLSERLFSIHKFLLELLRNRVTTSQKHCTAVSMLLHYDIGMPSTTSKCYGICERMSVFRLNGDHRD